MVVDIPNDEGIETVKNHAEDVSGIDVGVSNSGGYEIKWSSDDAREWLLKAVDKNAVRFDNPARIDAGHPYVLILPDE